MESTEMYVKEVQIELIDTDGQMVRAGLDDDHVIELSVSIGKHGLLEPIVVSDKGNGRYQLIAGFHRLLACRRLNWKAIPAHIRKMDSEDVIKGLALIENIIRKDMSLKEECDAVILLTEQEGLSVSQVCQMLGRSREWVNRRLMAPQLPDNIREALFAGMISVSAAEVIATVEEEYARNIILNEAIYAKRNLVEIEAMVQTFKATPSITEAVQQAVTKAKEIQDAPPPKRICDLGEEVVSIHDMRVLWVCPGCYKEQMQIKGLAQQHAQGGK